MAHLPLHGRCPFLFSVHLHQDPLRTLWDHARRILVLLAQFVRSSELLFSPLHDMASCLLVAELRRPCSWGLLWAHSKRSCGCCLLLLDLMQGIASTAALAARAAVGFNCRSRRSNVPHNAPRAVRRGGAKPRGTPAARIVLSYKSTQITKIKLIEITPAARWPRRPGSSGRGLFEFRQKHPALVACPRAFGPDISHSLRAKAL